jgi:hypothetical protein
MVWQVEFRLQLNQGGLNTNLVTARNATAKEKNERIAINARRHLTGVMFLERREVTR